MNAQVAQFMGHHKIDDCQCGKDQTPIPAYSAAHTGDAKLGCRRR